MHTWSTNGQLARLHRDTHFIFLCVGGTNTFCQWVGSVVCKEVDWINLHPTGQWRAHSSTTLAGIPFGSIRKVKWCKLVNQSPDLGVSSKHWVVVWDAGRLSPLFFFPSYLLHHGRNDRVHYSCYQPQTNPKEAWWCCIEEEFGRDQRLHRRLEEAKCKLDLYFLDDLRAGPPICTGSIITTSDMEMARSQTLV